jgi:hypothetical protein
MPGRRQGGVRQVFRPRRNVLLTAGLHRKVRPQVAGVGAEAEHAGSGDQQEQTEEHENEHGNTSSEAGLRSAFWLSVEGADLISG